MGQQPYRGGPTRPAQSGSGQGRSHAGADAFDEDLTPPTPRMVYFSRNDPPCPREGLFEGEAQQIAKQFCETVPASQLRRFYAFATRLRDQIETTGVPDEVIRGQMALLKARAAYVRKRNQRYTREFVVFFTRHADAVRNRDDFVLGFYPHFEAVVAYHKVFGREN